GLDGASGAAQGVRGRGRRGGHRYGGLRRRCPGCRVRTDGHLGVGRAVPLPGRLLPVVGAVRLPGARRRARARLVRRGGRAAVVRRTARRVGVRPPSGPLTALSGAGPRPGRLGGGRRGRRRGGRRGGGAVQGRRTVIGAALLAGGCVRARSPALVRVRPGPADTPPAPVGRTRRPV